MKVWQIFASISATRLEVVLAILQLVARDPLDAAADTWFLFGCWRLGRKHGVECGAQVMSVNRDAIRGPAVVELAAVNQFLLSVEQIEIRCAGGTIRLGDRLTLVMQVRECITPGCCLFFHVARVIRRVGVHVIAVDGIDGDATGAVLGSYAREFFTDVNNKRTVVADEHDERCRGIVA